MAKELIMIEKVMNKKFDGMDYKFDKIEETLNKIEGGSNLISKNSMQELKE